MMRKGVKISLPVFIIIFLTMLFSFEVKSQDNYKPGYIISNDGDTTRTYKLLRVGKNTSSYRVCSKFRGSDEVIAAINPKK